jgi:HKD family nuclease
MPNYQGFIPNIDRKKVFETALKNTEKELIVVSPYIKSTGIDTINLNLSAIPKLKLVTKLSVRDCATGAYDPEKVLDFVLSRNTDDCRPKIWINQRLHAKCYIFDRKSSIIGSLNLTHGGLIKNREMTYLFKGKSAKNSARTIKKDIVNYSQKISIDSFEKWVAAYKALKFKKNSHDEDYAEAQDELDQSFSFLSESPFSQEPNLEVFLDWLSANQSLLGAKTLVKHFNGYQSRSGHAKQSYFACFRFFEENKDLIEHCSLYLNIPEKKYSDFPSISNQTLNKFSDFLKKNSKLQHEGFSIDFLFGNLGGKWGGAQTEGGGAGGSLQRTIPLLAKWVIEHSK